MRVFRKHELTEYLVSVGEALIDAIDELINQGRIEPQLAMKILSNFDRAIAENLAANVKSRLNFKGHLETYRFCDDVWTFLVKDVKFKSEGGNEFTADKVKIVSCNSKKPGEQ
ncbi:uncharacterized protein HMPREF1541_10040 [Cyphellophora europaea CBS 101466]|uniref:Transcription initiation factor IIA subunit 2 n=1 Tax=Cyphellophora europaea (strain CBS 101466) TaxID=1220924 RepID=W2SAW3_CYPE1|nr:uncharacterized protein HMPREF1541_10040 [Cyphellophora europaea CBS 101466]ETN45163.1 hypothetical protein HMPREF1541_10040 [Cyphellophora europaea CBS 101466]